MPAAPAVTSLPISPSFSIILLSSTTNVCVLRVTTFPITVRLPKILTLPLKVVFPSIDIPTVTSFSAILFVITFPQTSPIKSPQNSPKNLSATTFPSIFTFPLLEGKIRSIVIGSLRNIFPFKVIPFPETFSVIFEDNTLPQKLIEVSVVPSKVRSPSSTRLDDPSENINLLGVSELLLNIVDERVPVPLAKVNAALSMRFIEPSTKTTRVAVSEVDLYVVVDSVPVPLAKVKDALSTTTPPAAKNGILVAVAPEIVKSIVGFESNNLGTVRRSVAAVKAKVESDVIKPPAPEIKTLPDGIETSLNVDVIPVPAV